MYSRLRYYFSSIPTLLWGIQNWPACLAMPLRRKPLILQLRNGLRFQVQTWMDVWIIKETCLDRDYEKFGTAIQPGWTVIDIGAAAGDFAVLTASEHKDARILAFEPSPASFEALQTNLQLNHVKNVHAFQQAVASNNAPLFLSMDGAAVQHSTTHAAQKNSIQVAATTLEELLNENGIARCHFLKMDCEGGEFDILLNSPPEILSNFERICLEYHDGFTEFSHTDLAKHLQQNGYQVKITPNPVHRYLGFLYAHR